MNVLLAALLLATGVIAGVVGGLLGIGGCSIMLPVLIFIYHYPEPIAIGTTITAVILTAASGAIAHLRMRNVDMKTVAIVGSSGTLGAVVGDILFNYLSKKLWLLDVVLGAAFIYTAARMVWEGAAGWRAAALAKTIAKAPAASRAADPHAREPRIVPGSPALKAVIGFGVGVTSGILGLGGGYLLVPLFIYVLSSPVKIAVGTSLPSFLPLAIASAVPKLLSKSAEPLAAVLLGAGTIAGAQVGARLVPRTPSWLIKLLFGLVFLAVSIKFIIKGLSAL